MDLISNWGARCLQFISVERFILVNVRIMFGFAVFNMFRRDGHVL